MEILNILNLVLTILVVPLIYLAVFRNYDIRSMRGINIMIVYYNVMLVSELSIQSYWMSLFYVIVIMMWIFIKKSRIKIVKRMDDLKKQLDSIIIKELSQLYNLNEDDFKVVENKDGDRELMWKDKIFDASEHNEKKRD